ncbi:metal-dependent hydrolase [Pontibacillus salicampi]|uniref:Metal-dependent hydrolase n=1 Tax=Pontibacillus salicampi TaxID=1449801 RepID=A0ABV6LLX2_9BACI
MNTLHHGFWTYVVLRNRKEAVKYAMVGSIFPDIVYYIMFLYILIFGDILTADAVNTIGWTGVIHDMAHALFAHPVVEVLRQAGHSIAVWAIVYCFVAYYKGWRINRWTGFLYGWLGHIVIDLLTHVEDAIPLFYPFSDLIIRGPISYWNPTYHGDVFSFINGILIIVAIIWLIIQKVNARSKRSL